MRASAVAVTGLVVGAGVASAAAPNAPTTINGCVGLTGLLRVLEPPATSCGLLEKPLQWNAQGPAGGVRHHRIPARLRHRADPERRVPVRHRDCPAGKRVLSVS